MLASCQTTRSTTPAPAPAILCLGEGSLLPLFVRALADRVCPRARVLHLAESPLALRLAHELRDCNAAATSNAIELFDSAASLRRYIDETKLEVCSYHLVYLHFWFTPVHYNVCVLLRSFLSSML